MECDSSLCERQLNFPFQKKFFLYLERNNFKISLSLGALLEKEKLRILTPSAHLNIIFHTRKSKMDLIALIMCKAKKRTSKILIVSSASIFFAST